MEDFSRKSIELFVVRKQAGLQVAWKKLSWPMVWKLYWKWVGNWLRLSMLLTALQGLKKDIQPRFLIFALIAWLPLFLPKREYFLFVEISEATACANHSKHSKVNRWRKRSNLVCFARHRYFMDVCRTARLRFNTKPHTFFTSFSVDFFVSNNAHLWHWFSLHGQAMVENRPNYRIFGNPIYGPVDKMSYVSLKRRKQQETFPTTKANCCAMHFEAWTSWDKIEKTYRIQHNNCVFDSVETISKA